MNSIIPFKKNIIFKTKINEITDISLTHDYKVLDDMIEGEFYLSGTYKMTEASLINEEYYYNIPFSIALSDRINKDTINLKLESFDYKIDGDTLYLSVNLEMEAEEIKEDRNLLDNFNDFKDELAEKLGLDKKKEDDEKDENLVQEEKQEEKIEDVTKDVEVKENDTEVTKGTISGLLSNLDDKNSYITYKVHIVRNGDTIETISDKYNVSIDDIKEYNNVETINIGDKILVPFIYNE